MAVDGKGRPVEFCLSPGNTNDCTMTSAIIGKLKSTAFVVADKGYDSNDVRSLISASGAMPVIPRKINSTIGNTDMNWNLYKLRHIVENTFARLKHFRAIATMYSSLRDPLSFELLSARPTHLRTAHLVGVRLISSIAIS